MKHDFEQTQKLPIDVLRMHALSHRLQKFPHIVARIGFQWGSQDCRRYLYGLVVGMDHRVGRQGFPITVLDALDALLDLHDEFYPNYIPTDNSWEQRKF